jgi:hypothetical protein
MTEPTSAQELFKGRKFDQEIIVLCVRWYLTFKLSSRDLVQMMAERGITLTHTTILRWVQRYVPEFEKCWSRYARPVGDSWRVDETEVLQLCSYPAGCSSWLLRFAVYSNGGNLSRRSSCWQWGGTCAFPFRTATLRSCSPSGACAPITSQSGGGSSATPRNWSGDCANGSRQPTTLGGWMRRLVGLDPDQFS